MYRTVLVAAALLCSPLDAQTVLYNNLRATPISNLFSVDSPPGPLSNSFSTGPTATTLTDVKLYLQLQGSANGGSTFVSLFSSTNNAPVHILQVLGTIADGSISSSGPGVYDFPVSPPAALQANTRYFIDLIGNNSVAAWITTNQTNGTGNISTEYNCRAVPVNQTLFR